MSATSLVAAQEAQLSTGKGSTRPPDQPCCAVTACRRRSNRQAHGGWLQIPSRLPDQQPHRSGMCFSLKLNRPTPTRLARAPTSLRTLRGGGGAGRSGASQVGSPASRWSLAVQVPPLSLSPQWRRVHRPRPQQAAGSQHRATRPL